MFLLKLLELDTDSKFPLVTSSIQSAQKVFWFCFLIKSVFDNEHESDGFHFPVYDLHTLALYSSGYWCRTDFELGVISVEFMWSSSEDL